MYSAYYVKCAGWQYAVLTYPFPNFEPVYCSMSGSNCCFLTCIQVSQEVGKMVWYSHFLKNFPQFVVTHSQRLKRRRWSRCRCFSGIFLLFLRSSGFWQFDQGFSVISKCSLYIWKFLVHVLLKPILENFEHYFASMWESATVSYFEHSLLLPFFGIGRKTDSVPWPLAEFSKFAGILSVVLQQHRVWSSSAGIPSPLLALFIVISQDPLVFVF